MNATTTDRALPRITADQVIEADPCWTGEGVRGMFEEHGGDGLTILDALGLHARRLIAWGDLLWLVGHVPWGPTHLAREWACREAEAALGAAGADDPRAREAIAAERAFRAGRIGEPALVAAYTAAAQAVADLANEGHDRFRWCARSAALRAARDAANPEAGEAVWAADEAATAAGNLAARAGRDDDYGAARRAHKEAARARLRALVEAWLAGAEEGGAA